MSSLESTLLDFGIEPTAIDPTQVGIWQRLPTADKPRSRNGAAYQFPDGGWLIQDWRTGERAVVQADGRSSGIPMSRVRDAAAVARQRRKREMAGSARTAVLTWEGGCPAAGDHPYLVRKNLPPLELRETDSINGWRGRWLICPLYSAEPLERIRNLECINERGDKRPIRGALRSAVFGFAGAGMPTTSVVVCEGWATAAALHVALGMPIVFAAGAHNLAPVAAIWRKGLPDAEIVIAADDDADGKGLENARKAAEAADGATIKMPNFGRLKGSRTDWCDVHTAWGAELVRELWHG